MIYRALIFSVCLVVGTGAGLAQGGKKSSSVSVPVDAPECAGVSFTDGAMVCTCPANASSGSVWGSGPYTADSNICTAARHAGAIDARGGVVRLTERPGQASYSGSSANGVSTSDWGSYGQSFDIVGLGQPARSELATCTQIPAGVEDYTCHCPANPPVRSVWGNSPYTADSDICTAAVHTGYIEAGEGGDVHVLRTQGLSGYVGGESFGVTTSDWNAYDSSIVFDWNR